MRRITEEEAWRLAGISEPLLLCKIEHDPTESTVALKRFPDCFVLGVSSDSLNRFELYAFDREAEAQAAFERHAERMKSFGAPFFD